MPSLVRRRIYDDECNAQFVTFSCYWRRRLVDHPRCRQIVMGVMADKLAKRDGICCGFVSMPDHVHAIVWFPAPGCLSGFMQMWKSRSSRQLKKFIRGQMPEYMKSISPKDPFWQPKYYPFDRLTLSRRRLLG